MRERTSRSRWLAIVFILAAASILATGAWFMRNQEHNLRRQAGEHLQSIADLKVGQIVGWRAERLGNGAMLMVHTPFIADVTAWMQAPGAPPSALILNVFQSLQRSYQYSDVWLVDGDGRVLLGLENVGAPLHDVARQALEVAWREGRPVMTDLHLRSGDAAPHQDVIAPLFAPGDGASTPVAAVVLRVDARQFLFPLLHSWPVRSETAESYLVRADGDAVLLLSPARRVLAPLLSLRMPLTQEDAPSVQAVRGATGLLEGTDYRGVPVWAAAQPVPDSPWIMLAKMDVEEALAPWRQSAVFTTSLVLALLVAAAAAVAVVWQRDVKEHYQAVAAAESAQRASQEQYRQLVEMSPDAVIVHQDGKVVFANAAGARLLRANSANDLIGKPISEIVHPDNWPSTADRIRRVLGGESGLYPVQIRYTRVDGTVADVEAMAAPLPFEGKPAVQVVVRDISDRLAAERQLRAADERLRTAVRAANVGLWDEDLVTNQAYYSPEWKRQLGYEPDEIGSDRSEWQKRVHPDDLAPTLQLEQAYLKNPWPDYHVEFRLRHKDGSYRWIMAQGSLVTDDAGKPVRLIGSHIDITATKRAENALREARDRAQQYLDVAGVILLVLDTQHRVVLINAKGGEILGYAEADLLGQDWLERVVPPRLRRRMAGIFAGLAAGDAETDAYVENEVLTKAGEERLIAWSNVLLRDEAGAVTGILSSGEDITERGRLWNALRESEERLRSLYENATVGLYRTTPDGRIILANPALVRMLGYSSFEDLAQRNLSEQGYEPTYPRREFQQRVESEGEIRGLESAWQRRDGSTIYVRESARAMRDDSGRTLYYEGTAEDITERKLAEEAIRALNAELEERVRQRTAQLEEANKEMEAFSYSVSHDLRAPLRAVDGFARILQEDHTAQLDEEGRRVLGVVRAEATRMGQLIDDLLAFSRLSRQPMQPATIDMTALAGETFARLSALEPARDVQFGLQPLPPIQGDANLLRQVWANLLSNALKFTRPRQRAEIEAGGGRQGDEAVYYVRDNGVGFDMAYVDRVWGVFQRLHRQDEFEGTGVGLPLVQRIVHRHGGRVWAEGSPGKGATFYFALPLGKEE